MTWGKERHVLLLLVLFSLALLLTHRCHPRMCFETIPKPQATSLGPSNILRLGDARLTELKSLIFPSSNFSDNPINLPAMFPALMEKLPHNCNSFTGENFECFIEWDEWIMSAALVKPSSGILELGARWGTTSCILASLQNNTGRIVAVEPQSSVIAGLKANRDAHLCNFNILNGIVGEKNGFFDSPGGYGSRTCVQQPCNGGEQVQAVKFEEVEAFVGFQFDTLLFDCEGCIQDILPLEDRQPLLKNIQLILMEEDMAIHLRQSNKYQHWHDVFVRAGFQNVWHSHDTFSPQSALWSWEIRHTAWIRPDKYGPYWTGCNAFALKYNVPHNLLQCVGDSDGNPWFPKPQG